MNVFELRWGLTELLILCLQDLVQYSSGQLPQAAAAGPRRAVQQPGH